MPLYPFKCSCGYETDEFRPYSECSKPKDCTVCGNSMQRVFTPPAVRPNGIHRAPPGTVELGNEMPNPKKTDHMAGVDKIMHEFMNTSSDPEVRAMNA